jgi:hypothetical protein
MAIFMPAEQAATPPDGQAAREFLCPSDELKGADIVFRPE